MARWQHWWELRQRKKKALQLLMVTGAVRPADVEPRYWGPDRSIARRGTQTALAARPQSIWTTDLAVLWKRRRLTARPSPTQTA